MHIHAEKSKRLFNPTSTKIRSQKKGKVIQDNPSQKQPDETFIAVQSKVQITWCFVL